MENEITPPTGEIKKNRIEPPQKTFFFERHDGSIIHVLEKEAWNLLKGGNRVIGIPVPPPKLIGVSDGTKFHQAVKEAHVLHSEGKIQEAMERLRTGEQEELEAARGHIERPRNFEITDNRGNPTTLDAKSIRI